MSKWTDTQRADALAKLEANGGNVSKTARQVSIPRPTIVLWRDNAIATGKELPLPKSPKIDWQPIREQAGEMYLANAELAAQIVCESLERFQGSELSMGDTQRVAVIMGISADKGMDAIFGKRGTEFNVNVDARSLHLPALQNLTTDELRVLAQKARPVEAAVVSVDGIRSIPDAR